MEAWSINGLTLSIEATNTYTCNIPYVPSWMHPGWFAYAAMFGYGGGGGYALSEPQKKPLDHGKDCTPPALPGGTANKQIEEMVSAAVAFQTVARMTQPYGNAPLIGFLLERFLPSRPWDFKANFPKGTPDHNQAAVFGNFAFAAVMQALAYSLEDTLFYADLVGVAVDVLLKGKNAVGDPPEDVLDIANGWNYQKNCP